MLIGLIDIDSHNFPNLALMKISAYHKKQGDSVEWYFGLKKYDKVYMSKVFTNSQDYTAIIMTEELIIGGTGYNFKSNLPSEIETVYPDYSLYKITDTAYGFLTRGCPRKCDFCIVSKKEGIESKKVADLSQFWKGQKNINLLDPNILACKDYKELFLQLIDSKAYVDFTQGLDIRLMTDESAELIKQMKIKCLHFAWDKANDFYTLEQLKKYRKILGYDRRKMCVYVLTNFNTNHKEDIYRIEELKQMDYDPYIMIYDKDNAPRQTRYLQRYVNNKRIFRTIKNFSEYRKTETWGNNA